MCSQKHSWPSCLGLGRQWQVSRLWQSCARVSQGHRSTAAQASLPELPCASSLCNLRHRRDLVSEISSSATNNSFFRHQEGKCLVSTAGRSASRPAHQAAHRSPGRSITNTCALPAHPTAGAKDDPPCAVRMRAARNTHPPVFSACALIPAASPACRRVCAVRGARLPPPAALPCPLPGALGSAERTAEGHGGARGGPAGGGLGPGSAQRAAGTAPITAPRAAGPPP